MCLVMIDHAGFARPRRKTPHVEIDGAPITGL